MSVLQRYRKRGGFLKLLQLVETSDPKKQETLLKVIEKEDKHWAESIRKKSLTFDRFCTWRVETQYTILSNLTDQYKFIACKRLPESVFTALMDHMNDDERITFDNDYQHIKEPLDGEFLAAQARLFETIRELNEENVIVLSQIDPSLTIPDAA